MSSTLRNTVQVLKAVSDRQRLRILVMLRDGELCACQFVEVLGLAASTVSRHLTVLHDAGLVAARKEGRWTYYRWPDDACEGARAALFRWLPATLDGDETIAADRARVSTLGSACPDNRTQEQE